MNILIADDHELIINGIADLIAKTFHPFKVYKALNKTELYNCLRATSIDLLIQDIRFGADDALSFLPDIKTQYPQLIIIALTSISSLVIINKLSHLKINGIVLKSDNTEELIQAIKNCLEKQVYESAQIKLLKKSFDQSTEIILSKREKEILTEILHSKTIKQIAETLFISTKTVEMHRSNLFIKFDVQNVTGLINKVLLTQVMHEGFNL